MSLLTSLVTDTYVDPWTYEETYPWWYASTSSNPTTNSLHLAEAPRRNTSITIGVVRVLIGATSNGNLKVAVYTFDGTTWTLAGSSASTAVGAISTIQAVSLQSTIVVPAGVRRFYGFVTDGTATVQRMAGPSAAIGLLSPDTMVKVNSFTLPSTFVIGDVTSTNIMPWMRGSAT